MRPHAEPSAEGTLFLTRSEVARLLDMETCIEIMRSLQAGLGALPGQGPSVTYPVRSVFSLPTGGPEPKFFGSMPAHARLASGQEIFGAKCLSVFPGNPRSTGRESHQGIFTLFDGEDGRLLGLFDAAEITAQRTAATSAVAARTLLPTGCDISEGAQAAVEGIDVAIVGTGVQARRHALAFATAMRRTRRPVQSIRLCARTPDSPAAITCQQDIVRILQEAGFGARGDHPEVAVLVQPLAQAALECDILCTVTSSREPVLTCHEHLSGRAANKPVLIIAVGACTPTARELGGDVIAAAGDSLWVDNREGAGREAGDLLLAAQEGHLSKPPTEFSELAEVVSQPERHNRSVGSRVALFKSLGNGAQDLAVAHHLYQAAHKNRRRRIRFDA